MMKPKQLIAAVLLSLILQSCGKDHIEFTIVWSEVWKAVGYVALGIIIMLGIIIYIFRNFKVWK